MKVLIVVCIFAVAAISLAHGSSSLEDLEGVWSGQFDPIFVFIFSGQSAGIICRYRLTPECNNELSVGMPTIVVDNYTVAFNTTYFDGASTPEKSAKLFPACAASGILPRETVNVMLASQIVDFDSDTERLDFIDSRRPDEVNCVFVTLNRHKKVPSLTVQYTISDEGTLEQINQNGVNFICERQPGVCRAEANENGLSVTFFVDYESSCVSGACLDLSKPVAVSKKHFIVAKKTSKDHHEG